MATLGRWTGGVQSQGNPPESWTAPSGFFPTQQRNDSSAYTWTSSTSTLTLPSSDLADGYLLVAHYEYEDTSNGRLNPQGQLVQASGTGTFVGGPSAGFNRDNSEDRSFVRAWGFVDNPSASATFQFQWKADTDDSTGGTVQSSFEVIPFYYADIGLYSSTSSSLYGGTTPNQVTGFSGTDGTNITLASNVVSVTGDNKDYLILGSQFFEGRGGRTQRWHGLEIDSSQENAAKAYSYYRNTANDESGEIFTHLIRTATATRTIEQTCYRGDGVSAGQGGADSDGSTPTVGDHALVVIELNDSAEVFHSVDGTGGVDLNVTGPVDQSVCRTGDITFNDSASFTRASDSAMNCVGAFDGLFGANISAAQEVVSTTSRWTSRSHFTVNGVEDNDTRSGDYSRNNQSSIDTFGWSANLLSFVAVADGDDVGVSVQELSGGEDGGQYEVQPGWSGFWGINLDTLEDAGGTDALLADDVESTSEVGTPDIGQEHAILANDTESASEVSTPTIGQVHGLLADDVQSTSEVSQPALSESNVLLADDVESASEVSTPTIGQVHAVTSVSVESASEVSIPSVGQDHAILANDVESASEVSTPNLVAVAGTDNLLADDVESTSEVSIPSLGQDHSLLADDVESASEVTSPAITQTHGILADDTESASEVTVPDLGQAHGLLANDVESTSEVSVPSLTSVAGVDNLSADDVESASEVGSPVIGQAHVLTANDTESASEVSSPTIGQTHALLGEDVESTSEVSTPDFSLVPHDLFANDIEASSEVSSPAIGQSHSLNADDVESGSEVSIPVIAEIYNLFANDVESQSSVSIPILGGDAIELYLNGCIETPARDSITINKAYNIPVHVHKSVSLIGTIQI